MTLAVLALGLVQHIQDHALDARQPIADVGQSIVGTEWHGPSMPRARAGRREVSWKPRVGRLAAGVRFAGRAEIYEVLLSSKAPRRRVVVIIDRVEHRIER